MISNYCGLSVGHMPITTSGSGVHYITVCVYLGNIKNVHSNLRQVIVLRLYLTKFYQRNLYLPKMDNTDVTFNFCLCMFTDGTAFPGANESCLVGLQRMKKAKKQKNYIVSIIFTNHFDL